MIDAAAEVGVPVAVVTVSIAEVLIVLPMPLATITENCALLSAVVSDGVV